MIFTRARMVGQSWEFRPWGRVKRLPMPEFQVPVTRDMPKSSSMGKGWWGRRMQCSQRDRAWEPRWVGGPRWHWDRSQNSGIWSVARQGERAKQLGFRVRRD